MNFGSLFSNKKNKIVLIVQCRLSSTRLPRKALLNLGGKTVLDWVLDSMSLVSCDERYLATDEESAESLKEIAKKHGWKFFAGSKNDVLDRFCKVIELSKADFVIRATADNPFLFYEAANSLCQEYLKREKITHIDYMTWKGLPHGSGVEMFNAHSLVKARDLTSDPFDHEHVGPALYNHKDSFNCIFEDSPKRFNFPFYRTTIDTPSDYRRALSLVAALSGKNKVNKPYTTEEILQALEKPSVKNPIIFLPSVKKGHGTGHLRRCLDLALETGGDVYVPLESSLDQAEELILQKKAEGLEDYQIVRTIPTDSSYSLAVTDLFNDEEGISKKLSQKMSVCALDEGSSDTDHIDYILNIIPGGDAKNRVNLEESAFIPLPDKIHSEKDLLSPLTKALVTLGGEDPAGLSLPCAISLAENGLKVFLVAAGVDKVQSVKSLIPDNLSEKIQVLPPVKDLKNHLAEYDLVCTHYGFTAFEARAAGCAVILAATSPLHERLSKNEGFVCLSSQSFTKENLERLLENPSELRSKSVDEKSENKSLSQFLISLSYGKRLLCPVCQKKKDKSDTLVSRTPERTFRRCSECGMLYMSWTKDSLKTEYKRSYFYEDYEKQYGKTYIEDFPAIKSQCVRRMCNIDQLFRNHHSPVTPSVLDIGCAMGPFLDAANDSGWQVFGTDISPDAVDYVQNTLHYPVVLSAFPDLDTMAEFGLETFEAVTMWYVIEHFQNLDSVLKAVAKLVKKGGIFAFSTPSGSGISAISNSDLFFKNSPSDHYSIWEPKKAASILKKYGFKVEKIISTGIHPERHPCVKKHGWKASSLQAGFLRSFDAIAKKGDTFEIYCRKV